LLRYGATRTGENRAEHTINTGNVTQLHQTWTDTTNNQVTSPVVSRHASFVAASGTTTVAFDTRLVHDRRRTKSCSGSPRTCTVEVAVTSGTIYVRRFRRAPGIPAALMIRTGPSGRR
jgi:hypothetical protein